MIATIHMLVDSPINQSFENFQLITPKISPYESETQKALRRKLEKEFLESLKKKNSRPHKYDNPIIPRPFGRR